MTRKNNKITVYTKKSTCKPLYKKYNSMSWWHNSIKAVPLHAMEAPEEVRSYSSYSFLTSAMFGEEWLASCLRCALPLGK
jgi:hypothetical protein